ncbi:uncharacterized protein UTRI_00972 [Ustilago trichophora]|uniref:Uncharacterized protein n=1 Tax=Ustilago trichophora TaxID=86804 RepID=A0A5C3DUY3_9BASI|nr:uncharacterized protein UTRI_00972 [Ustilago trichophora]
MSQPNTAAIAVASIFGGIALIFVAYKTYRKVWNCMHRPEQLPPISQPPTAYHGGVVMSTVSEIPTFHSIRRTGSSHNYLAASSASNVTSPQHDGLTSTSTSEMPSPSIRALDSIVLSSPSDIYDPHYRGASTISSSSSTMTLKRSYLKSASASQLSYLSNSSRRESYLPHSPLNRDSIQIIPPQPLGFGGNMAMATDQKTLAFSTNSGIGASEDFTSGLVWTDPSDHGSRSRSSHRPHLAQQNRQRYLMEGPMSTRNSEAPSLLSSSQGSPLAQTMPLEHSPDGESPFGNATPPDSQQANTQSESRLESKPSIINSQLLGAKDSPLQRLQSNAGQAQPPPHMRLPSDGNSNRSDSDASPILSPFVHHSSPPSTGDRAALSSPESSSADAGTTAT